MLQKNQVPCGVVQGEEEMRETAIDIGDDGDAEYEGNEGSEDEVDSDIDDVDNDDSLDD